MQENVVKEINDLHNMIQNWKKFWLTQYDDAGGNEWIMEEFTGEISEYIFPYLRRLFECDHITKEDYAIFVERTRGEIVDLRQLLQLPLPE